MIDPVELPRGAPSGFVSGERNVTKKEIVRQISEELGMTQLKTKEIVQKTFDAIIESLVTNGKIELRNFGVFKVKLRQRRKARNPKTDQRIDVPAKFVVTFKPGKRMEERIRQMERKKLRRAEGAAEKRQSGDSKSDGRPAAGPAVNAEAEDSASGNGDMLATPPKGEKAVYSPDQS